MVGTRSRSLFALGDNSNEISENLLLSGPSENYAEANVFESGVMAVETGTAHITLAVDTTLVESYESNPIHHGVRVVVNGEEIPSTDLVGEISINKSRDTPLTTAKLQLAGTKWSIFKTLATWTKVPVAIYHLHGPAKNGEDAIVETLEFGGLVLPPTDQNGTQPEPVITLQCASLASYYDRDNVCITVASHSGYTRGGFVRYLAEQLGIPSVDVPDGGEVTRPISTAGKRLFEFLQPFGDPEGWSWQVDPDGTLRAIVDDLKKSPTPADHVWRREDLIGIQPKSTGEVASTWQIRGYVPVEIDELGAAVQHTIVEIRDNYAPVACEQKQNADGSLSSTGATQPAADLRLVSRIETTLDKVGGSLNGTIVRRFGWYNPRAAYLRTPAAAEADGPIGAGYYYTECYVDPGGNHRAWDAERFVEISKEMVSTVKANSGDSLYLAPGPWTWDFSSGGLADALPDIYKVDSGVASSLMGWGVVSVPVTDIDGSSWVHGVGIADDGKAYVMASDSSIETQTSPIRHSSFGTRDFDLGDGRSVHIESAHYSEPHLLRGSIDSGLGHFLGYDGLGYAEDASQMRPIKDILDSFYTMNGIPSEWYHNVSDMQAIADPSGSHDWGTFQSQAEIETVQIDPDATFKVRYENVNGSTYTEIKTDGNGKEVSRERKPGAPAPPPTNIPAINPPANNTLDRTIYDATAETWFGASTVSLSSDWAETPTEALNMLIRARRRAASPPVTVVKPAGLGEIGDTVELIDDSQGLHHRAMLAGKERSIKADGSAIDTINLEVFRG